MIWLKRMRGARVVYSGKCIGRVVQGCLSDDLCVLDGFWFDRMLGGLRFVSAEHICVIGEQTVTVDHPGEKLRMKPRAFLLRAVTTDGKRLGAIVDAGIDRQTLTVNQLALVRSWMDGLLNDHVVINSFKRDISGERVIISEHIAGSEV